MAGNGGCVAEVLERVIQAQGRLLRVERVALAGPAGARASSALRLTFDVGIITLRPDAEGTALQIETGDVEEAGSEVFVSASEDDPWWAVMGNPLTRVRPRAAGGVCVQFRGDQESPRRFALTVREGGIEVSADG